MNILIIGLVAIAIGVASIRILKKKPKGEGDHYIDLVFTLIGVIGGFTLAYCAADISHTQQVRARAIGMIVSEVTADKDAIEHLGQRIEADKLFSEKVEANDDAAIQPVASPLNLPDTLQVILNDGELHKVLSKPFQERLPVFVSKLETYDEVFKVYIDTATESAHTGIYSLVVLELRTQRECLELELEYLQGTVGKGKHASRFARILDSQAHYVEEDESEGGDIDEAETGNASAE